jgi:hypothetical protein
MATSQEGLSSMKLVSQSRQPARGGTLTRRLDVRLTTPHPKIISLLPNVTHTLGLGLILLIHDLG